MRSASPSTRITLGYARRSDDDDCPFVTPRSLGGREHPHHARGRRRGREAGDALLDRQGQLGDAAPRAEGVLSGAAAVPAPARRHDLEVPGDVRVPRPDGARARPGADRAHQPGGCRTGDQPVRPRLGRPHRHHEDGRRSSRRSTSTGSTWRSAARGATRRRRAPRSASSRSAPRSTAGIPRTSGPSCGGCTTPASSRASRSACSRCRNWTELDVWHYIYLEQIPIVPLYFADAAAGRRARRHADHGRRRAHAARAGRDAGAAAGALPHARLLSADRRDRERRGRRSPEIIQEMLLATHLGAPGPRDRPRRDRLDGDARSRRATSDGRTRPSRAAARSRRTSSAHKPRRCCASSPAAASTTARAR